MGTGLSFVHWERRREGVGKKGRDPQYQRGAAPLRIQALEFTFITNGDRGEGGKGGNLKGGGGGGEASSQEKILHLVYAEYKWEPGLGEMGNISGTCPRKASFMKILLKNLSIERGWERQGGTGRPLQDGGVLYLGQAYRERKNLLVAIVSVALKKGCTYGHPGGRVSRTLGFHHKWSRQAPENSTSGIR